MADTISTLIQRGEELKVKQGQDVSRAAKNGVLNLTGTAPSGTNEWMSDVKLFSERKLISHPLHSDLTSVLFHAKNKVSDIDKVLGILKSICKDDDFVEDGVQTPPKRVVSSANKKVFIVHGHDDAAKESAARFVEKIGMESVILHEQANTGKTIIEKIEEYSDVGFAIVLYTCCDEGRAISEPELKKRARQNVVFEHGYLIDRLGRDRVCALVKGDLETPGDISGVVYVPMDANSAWQTAVVRDLKQLGYDIDANSLF